jgi:phosphatidylglycerophosphate synthase
MFDAALRRAIEPVMARLGGTIAGAGVGANVITAMGLACGLSAALAVALGHMELALALFLCGRLLDGLDGAVARATRKTDLGGFLDIVADFAVYAAIPLAFAVHAPQTNALPAVFLLASFYLNGAAFLTFALLSARRGAAPASRMDRSFLFMGGLAEGAETIAVFTAMLLMPQHFWWLAYGFAGLCMLSALGRIFAAARLLRDPA